MKYEKTVEDILNDSTVHHTHTHIEQRAPTDESIRILKEMHDKTLKSILKSISVKNNILDILLVFIDNERTDGLIRYYAKFKINNEEFTLEYSLSQREFNKIVWTNHKNQALNKILTKVYQDFSEKISIKLCQEMQKTTFEII